MQLEHNLHQVLIEQKKITQKIYKLTSHDLNTEMNMFQIYFNIQKSMVVRFLIELKSTNFEYFWTSFTTPNTYFTLFHQVTKKLTSKPTKSSIAKNRIPITQ